MGAVGEVFEEHRSLNERTRRLALLVGQEAGWEDLDGELAALAELLGRHFAAEESWLAGVGRRSDADARQAARILRQHARLDGTCAELRRLASGRQDWPALRAGVLDWIERLVAHEAAEGQLLMGSGLAPGP